MYINTRNSRNSRNSRNGQLPESGIRTLPDAVGRDLHGRPHLTNYRRVPIMPIGDGILYANNREVYPVSAGQRPLPTHIKHMFYKRRGSLSYGHCFPCFPCTRPLTRSRAVRLFRLFRIFLHIYKGGNGRDARYEICTRDGK